MALLKYKNADGSWETFDTPGAVKYIEQTLTEAEQAQVRTNIGSYITRDVIFSGSATSATFPSDKAPADYDLLTFKISSDNGSPATCVTLNPTNSHPVPTIYFVDINGNIHGQTISGVNSSTKGQTVAMATAYGFTKICKIAGIVGYKFEKEA